MGFSGGGPRAALLGGAGCLHPLNVQSHLFCTSQSPTAASLFAEANIED